MNCAHTFAQPSMWARECPKPDQPSKLPFYSRSEKITKPKAGALAGGAFTQAAWEESPNARLLPSDFEEPGTTDHEWTITENWKSNQQFQENDITHRKSSNNASFAIPRLFLATPPWNVSPRTRTCWRRFPIPPHVWKARKRSPRRALGACFCWGRIHCVQLNECCPCEFRGTPQSTRQGPIRSWCR